MPSTDRTAFYIAMPAVVFATRESAADAILIDNSPLIALRDGGVIITPSPVVKIKREFDPGFGQGGG